MLPSFRALLEGEQHASHLLQRSTYADVRWRHTSPHVLRRTCAMMIFQATGDLRKVSLWLGHAHMQTTEVYLHADSLEKIAALEAVVPPSLRRGRVTVPARLIASLQGTRL